MSDIFISYKHGQRQEPRQLTSSLGARGWMVWWDWNIPAGNDWQAELDAQLDAAACVVVLWSADSVRSEWVLHEARHALRTGKLIQVLLESAEPPAEFGKLQGIDLAGWDYGQPFHAGYDRLCAEIRKLLDRRTPVEVTHSGMLVRTRSDDGDLLRRDAVATPAARARPAPVMLLPPPFRDLLDRNDEREKIAAALAERKSISLAGPAGAGKSALLCNVANLDHTARFHDGVVYLTAAAQGEGDLAQAMHEAFFDVPPGVRPGPVELRRHLADKTALLMLDDVGLPPAGLDTLYAYAPGSAWIFASEQIAASARRRSVALAGLPVEDGVALFERAFSRPLSPDERVKAARIVETVDGHPARIEQAAGVAIMHGVAIALAALAATPNVADEDSKGRRVLAALACGGGASLESPQCAAIAQVDAVDDVLTGLVRRGLVQHVPPGFRLAAGFAPQVEATPEFATCRERATAVFMQFVFAARGTPRSVARLAAPMMAQMAWAAGHRRSDEALRLARALDGPLAGSNRWDAWQDMLARAYDIAVQAGDHASAGWALHQQGTRAILQGDKKEAQRLLKEARKTRKRIGDAAGLKATGNNLRLLGWARWTILLAVLASVGVTTLGAVGIVTYVYRPIAAVSPASVDFGPQDVRAAAQPQAVQIENKGRGTVDVIDVKAQGPNAKSFVVSSSCDGIRIPPTKACRLLVQFKPEDVGPRDATIVIRMRDIADTSMAVRGLGTAMPISRLSPETVDFGGVEIGGGAGNRSVTLRNEGSAPLAVSAIAIDGDPAFRIVKDGCRTSAIAPGAQCAIDLRFVPGEATAKHARLVLTDNASGSPRTVTLAGIGHATPKLEVAPGSLAFGQQETGTQSASRQVRLRNTGNAPVEIQRIEQTGGKAFRVQGGCDGRRLAPNSDCVIDVRFAPSAIESSSGRLVITSSAGSERTVDISGNGFGVPRIAVAPEQVDFGVVRGGATSKPRSVTITSTGSDSLLMRGASVTGDRRFSSSNGCPQQLPPKGQCSIDIGFDASGAGNAGARLVIAHNAGGGQSFVQLSAAIASIPPPVIERFDANPQTLNAPGGNVQLCYRASNAQELALRPSGQQLPSNVEGCVTRSVGATTTFVLTATGAGGTSQQTSRSVVVAVADRPPPAAPVILAFSADPAVLKGRGETRLCFRAQNAEVAVIDPGGDRQSSASGGCVSRQIAATTTFRLTVSRSGAAPRSSEVTVQVMRIAPPNDPTKGGGVITKEGPVKALPIEPAKPKEGPVGKVVPIEPAKPKEGPVFKAGPLEAAKIVGWCCKLGTVTRVPASSCASPGQWFVDEATARKTCAPQVIR